MTQWIDRLAKYETRRRTMFKVGGAAGVLLAAGVPSLAFAGNGQDNQNDGADRGGGRGVGQQKGKFQNIPVSGSVSSGAGGSFAGTFSVTKFALQSGQVVALGTLAGTLTDGSGTTLGNLSNVAASAPVVLPSATSSGAGAAPAATTQATTASCQILHLVLGPLNLNLLGLVISIPNPIVIDITAVPGPGNLLGNLLCAIANLLNGGSLSTLLQQLVTALNNLLAAL